jgi:hypothetical protein
MSKSNSNSNSYPFVPGQRMLHFDLEGNAITDHPENYDLLTNISYQIVAKMQECIEKRDLAQFKKLYTEEYIDNPAITDFFKFEDNPPYWEHNTYSLCVCGNREDETSKIHKYMYVRPCCCAGGKRYLAYLSAFNAGEQGLSYDTNPIYSKTLKKPSVTPIQQFLLDNGHIDLTYKAMYCTYDK